MAPRCADTSPTSLARPRNTAVDRREITFRFVDFDSRQITLSAIRLPTSKSAGASFLAEKGITAMVGCMAVP